MSDDHSPFALVVDDDVLIRMDAVDILAEAGFRTFEAGNVDEALAVLAEQGQNIQLLFTDVQMPGTLDGFDLARRCASDWPKIGILVASGQVRPESDELPKGAIFIGKPFSARIVHDRLNQLLPDGAKPEPLRKAVRG